MTRIKLCGVRTAADALMCMEEGADEIGVVFAVRSRRRVTIEEARIIRDALPADVPLVGVFLDAELVEVLRVAKAVGLSAAQLHGTWPARPAPLPLYAALQVTSEESLRPRPGAARVLLDGPAGGSGKSFPWSLAEKARALHTGELFVAGGLTAENVAQAIREAQPTGVDVAGGIENAAGFKDRARVRAFVRAAREADR
ncbi:MAG TPA: phosphoribosylanthranilate isomerase [Myxococcales bacterium]|jgi:phosphoribosylanthranilate isomerase|nr:phosphoribosylanthranilate isomerase [Myxococcales bacterium]